MVPPPRGVVFGPIKDWGKGGCKLLLEHDGEGGLKKRRQYTLENVAGWALIPEFRERGEEALSQAMANTEHARGEWRGEGDWSMHISQVEKDLREEEETIKVTDGPSAERAVEILKRSIAIQDGTVNGQLEGYDVEYQRSDKDDGILESITVRPAGADSGAMFGITHHWTLSTPRVRKRGGSRTALSAKEQLANLETELESISEGEGDSDEEPSRKQNAGNGKKRRLEPGKSLQELGKELGMESVEPAVPRSFEEIRSNVFGVPPPAWDLDGDKWPDGNGLEDSMHAVSGLTEEEVAGLMEDLVEGQRPTKEDADMEEATDGISGQGGSWKAVFELRSELELVGAIRENAEVLRQIGELYREHSPVGEGGWCADGDSKGKGGWRRLSELVIMEGIPGKIKAVVEAERHWRTALQVKSGALTGLALELKEVKEQLALLAVAMGAGTVEEVAQVKKTISARKGRVEEEKRKEAEVKKIEAKKRAVEAENRRDQAAQKEAEKVAAQGKLVRESQRRAWVACEETLAVLARRDRSALGEDELIELGVKMKEAKAMKERIERETKQPLETKIGRSRQGIDAKGKAELETAVGKVNMLLRTTGVTLDRTAWAVTARAGTGDFEDESYWSVGRVAQEIDPLKVAEEVGRMLVQAFGRSGEILNVWVEEGTAVRMITPAVPMTVARGRRGLAEKLREENKDMKGAKRMPKA
ncbi:hypothetical protein BGX38DRAFT_1276338 [Terfezia claveryi]|nr:hypothetical protein BGX38DRAFT_1276338 [Terfezia claveryi]